MTRNTVSLAQQWRSGEETAGLELPLLRTLALDVSVSSLRGLADRVLDLGVLTSTVVDSVDGGFASDAEGVPV